MRKLCSPIDVKGGEKEKKHDDRGRMIFDINDKIIQQFPLFHWWKHSCSPCHHACFLSLPLWYQWRRVIFPLPSTFLSVFLLFCGCSPWIHTYFMALNSSSTSLLFLVLFCVDFILFLFTLSRMYMLFGLLLVVATNLSESTSLISHFQELNMRVYPWSHIFLTPRRLCIKYSTNKTFATFTFSLPRFTTPFPSILIEESFPNVTLLVFTTSLYIVGAWLSCLYHHLHKYS